MKKIIQFGLLIVLLISIASFSFAKLTITPSVSVKEEYNDNIFLESSDEEDDFITTIIPNIVIEYSPNKSFDLSLDYGLHYRFYRRHSYLDDTSLKETQNIDFQAQARPSSRFIIDISDVYERILIDIKERVAEENVFFNMTQRNTFSVSPHMLIPLTSTVSTTVGYRYSNIWHEPVFSEDVEELVDSDNHTAFLTLNKKFPLRINGALKYNYIAYRPDLGDEEDEIDKYDRHEGSVVIAYQIKPNFEVSGEIGESWFDYTRNDNTHISFWNIGTDYSKADTKLGVSYGYSFGDSSTVGVFKRRRFDLLFETGKVLRLTINPSRSTDTYLNIDRKDKSTGVAMSISRPLTKNLDVLLNGLWEKQKFLPEPEDEEVRITSIGGRFDYNVSRSITTSFGYRYSNRDSNIEEEDFHNNIVWLQAKVNF